MDTSIIYKPRKNTRIRDCYKKEYSNSKPLKKEFPNDIVLIKTNDGILQSRSTYEEHNKDKKNQNIKRRVRKKQPNKK